MKRFFRVFELTKNEQRVVLIVILTLVAIAFASYEHRVHRSKVQRTAVVETKPPPSPAEIENER